MRWVGIMACAAVLAPMTAARVADSDPSPGPAVSEQIIPSAQYARIEPGDDEDAIIRKAAAVRPSARQLAYHGRAFIAFVHFGPNTFTRQEWGSGKEDPAVFRPARLDTDQWCEIMKAAGMSLVVLTVKHHDGFCLWQTRYTKHGVSSSPWRDGKGDVLRDLSRSCAKYGLKLGVYLSPVDLYQIEAANGLYGNGSPYSQRVIPRPVPGRPFKDPRPFEVRVDDYNEYFLNQLFELLTEYGPVHEVWLDGAHPKRKGNQQYMYQDWYTLIRALAPHAVIFGKGPDVRWCGNEAGRTRDSEWSVIPLGVHPEQCTWPDLTAEDLGSRAKLRRARYVYYTPAEVNTSIRDGWFYRDDEAQRVRSADEVFDIYERAVGGNGVFMLNVPPNRDGVISPRDEAVLREVGQRIRRTYGVDLTNGAESDASAVLDRRADTVWQPTGERGAVEIRLAGPRRINRVVLQEAIALQGQRVERHAVDAWLDEAWREVATGTTIGYKKILRFPAVKMARLRVRIEASRGVPSLSEVSAHFYDTEGDDPED
jgi:alpha-L-fucosidase